MKLRTVPMVMAISIAGLGLVGVGVHATFATSTSSGQTITAGTPSDPLSGSCVSETNCPVDANNVLYTLSPDGETLTFTPDTPSGLSFTTGDEEVTAASTGNIPLTDPTWVLSANGGTQLESEAYVCATSTGIGTNDTNVVLYNGLLSGFSGTSYALTGDEISTSGVPTATSGPTDNFVVDVYAGSEPTLCGTSFTNGVGTNASVGSPATPGTSAAPTLMGDSTGQSIAISVEMTYQY
jgi:hypothetical protein